MKSVSVKRLYDELDYWIQIGIGEDIFIAPSNRMEYQHLAIKFKDVDLDPNEKAKLVLIELHQELKRPWFMRPTFWQLLWIYIARKLTKISRL